MRRVVLIDGENLVYGLRHLFGSETKKAPRSAIDGFDFRGMLEEMLADKLPSEILWFGARLKQYTTTEKLERKSRNAILLQSKFVNHIQAQGIQFIKVGYLRARETDPCDKCSTQTWKLTEKGVDVGLAVRMMSEANQDTELIVVSADTDLLPAFITSSKFGAKIMHIGYEFRPIHALFSASNSSRTITLPIAQKFRAER